MKLTKTQLREIIREEISKLNKQPKMSTRLKELINNGWVLSEEDGTVKNPVTGREIKIKSALGYDKTHPAYKAAIKAKGSNKKYATAEDRGVTVPDWLEKKLESVHSKPGQGSIFAKPINVVMKIVDREIGKLTPEQLEKIATTTGTFSIKSPGIGYNLVLPIEDAEKLSGVKKSETEKEEGPNKISVPSISTDTPISEFETDQLTVVIRPKRDADGNVIKGEYITLSAFPGDSTIPPASKWEGKYAVINPKE